MTTWHLAQWLGTPSRVLVPLLTIILVSSLSKSQACAIARNFAISLSLSYLFIISPVGAFLSVRMLTCWLPVDAGNSADAIVVLGRGPALSQAGAEAVAPLWQSQRAPQVFVSGTKKEVSRIVAQLQKQGVPEQAISGESCSTTTEENAIFSAAVLHPNAIQRIVLVSDPSHLLRAWLTFRSLGFDAIPHMSSPDSFGAIASNSIQMSVLSWREYAALVKYGFLGRYRPRSFEMAIDLIEKRRPGFRLEGCVVGMASAPLKTDKL